MAKGRTPSKAANKVFTSIIKPNKETGNAEATIAFNDADGNRYESTVAIGVADGELVIVAGDPVLVRAVAVEAAVEALIGEPEPDPAPVADEADVEVEPEPADFPA